jgi:hypothetical protein
MSALALVRRFRHRCVPPVDDSGLKRREHDAEQMAVRALDGLRQTRLGLTLDPTQPSLPNGSAKLSKEQGGVDLKVLSDIEADLDASNEMMRQAVSDE